MSYQIVDINNESLLRDCFGVFHALREHLDLKTFLEQVKRQQQQGYQVIAVKDEQGMQSVAGFRRVELLAWGKVIYIDDLSTIGQARGKGYAGALLDYIIALAHSENLQAVHLDTGHHRHAAHRLYLNKGFEIKSHHLSLQLGA